MPELAHFTRSMDTFYAYFASNAILKVIVIHLSAQMLITNLCRDDVAYAHMTYLHARLGFVVLRLRHNTGGRIVLLWGPGDALQTACVGVGHKYNETVSRLLYMVFFTNILVLVLYAEHAILLLKVISICRFCISLTHL